MTIEQLQKEFKLKAEELGDYQILTKNELWNGYCDADEAAWRAKDITKDSKEEFKQEMLRSAFYAAIMLRYWYKIFDWMKESVSLGLEGSDFVQWLEESIDDTLYYRSWRLLRHDHQAEKEIKFANAVWIENPQFEDDEAAADKSMNYFTKAKRGKEYQKYNKDKRKAYVRRNNLDDMVDENGDYATNYANAITEESKDVYVEYLIKELVKRNEVLEALIVNRMSYCDCTKQEVVKHKEAALNDDGEEYEEEYVRSVSSFDPRRLVKYLNLVNEEFILSFSNCYDLKEDLKNDLYNKLKKLNNQKLYKLIDKTINEIRGDKTLLECFM